MNLYYDPTMMELRQLLDKAQPSLAIHNIAIDFDGEVIIDPEVRYPEVPLSKFKYHTQVKAKATPKAIKDLFINLIDGFNAQPRHLHGGKNIRLAA